MNKKTYEKLLTFYLNVFCIVLGFMLGGVYAVGHWSNLNWKTVAPKESIRHIEKLSTESVYDADIPYPLIITAFDTYVTVDDYLQTIDVGYQHAYNDTKLTALKGVNRGPSGKETWYNLDMSNIVAKMRAKGYSSNDYPYYIRDDGVKMLGDFVMIATDLGTHKRGDIVATSLGQGIVCDTGDFINTSDVEIDIATNW